MHKHAGRFLGLTLAIVLFGAGAWATMFLIDMLATDGAHAILTWCALGAGVVTLGLGAFLLIIWVDTDQKRGDRSWLS